MPDKSLTQEVLAPLSGRVLALSQVPDPIFAAETVGPGFAIDPVTNVVLAPFDGEVTQLHRCNHAIALRHKSGIEILIHVGIDTVMLRGEGFSPKVAIGQSIKAGDALIVCDFDKIANKAASLITPVLLVSAPSPIELNGRLGSIITARQLFYTVGATSTDVSSESGGERVVGSVRLKNPQGLHARPAAVLAARARSFSAQIEMAANGKSSDARSVTGLLGLNTRWGDIITITAAGADARHAVEGIVDSIVEGLGEATSITAPKPAIDAHATRGSAPHKQVESNVFEGVAASAGLGIGELYQRPNVASQLKRHGDGPEREQTRFDLAIQQLKDVLDAEIHQGAVTVQSIQRAHREMLSDPQLLKGIYSRILADQSAAYATNEALNDAAHDLRAMGNVLLAERATDLIDIRNRLLALIEPNLQISQDKPPKGVVLLAEELTPSEVASLKPNDVTGLISVQGGATGHVAILARALGVPAVLGVAPQILDTPNGTPILIDGDKGFIRLRPDAELIKAMQAKIAQKQQQYADDLQCAGLPATTLDGVTIEVAANIQTLHDAQKAVSAGADGVGLLRSEFLFDGRVQAPSETEQASVYVSIAQAIGPERTVVMRTLDAGGDKPLSYWPLALESNPFLGIRGVRLSLRYPEQIDTQLKAMMSAATDCRLHVLFPMVGLVEEIAELSERTKHFARLAQVDVKIGVMIEVPSAVLMADKICPHVDFFSIGTNDLTQYTLAMDRGHPELAKQADALHPAVLKLIDMTVQAAHSQKRWVGVCGALAAERIAWPLLLGMGIDELSMPSVVIAEAKAVIRRLRHADCQPLAREALSVATAPQVRELLERFAYSHL